LSIDVPVICRFAPGDPFGNACCCDEGMKSPALLVRIAFIVLTACSEPPETPQAEVPGSTTRADAIGSSEYVFTTDEGANAVSRIDTQSGEVRTVRLPIRPHNVQASPDGSQIAVAGPPTSKHEGHEGGSMPETRGRLLLIDTQSMDVATATAIDIGPHPAHVIFSSDGARAYVTDASINAVQVIDIRARRIEKEIPTGRYPHGLRASSERSNSPWSWPVPTGLL
jgi:YVTN family beta-propeller protein